MGVLNIKVNKRDYEIACADGEEPHIERLSYDLDKRVSELGRVMGGGASNSLLLVIAALQIMDELHETRHGNNIAGVDEEVDNATAAALSQVTGKLEEMAQKLEQKIAS